MQHIWWLTVPLVNQGNTRMNTAHATALETKHAGLDRRIADEVLRPLPDTALIAALKKQKLKIKEALRLN